MEDSLEIIVSHFLHQFSWPSLTVDDKMFSMTSLRTVKENLMGILSYFLISVDQKIHKLIEKMV